MSLNCTISNIQFDYAFHEAIKKASERVSDENLTRFSNGVFNQNVLIFKTICVLPDDEISSAVIREWCKILFGMSTTATSILRNLKTLSGYGFIDMIKNPHDRTTKYSYIKLTATGRKLQKLFIGSTSDWKDKPRVQLDRQVRTAMSGGSI